MDVITNLLIIFKYKNKKKIGGKNTHLGALARTEGQEASHGMVERRWKGTTARRPPLSTLSL